jgi:xanthine dehydrogenase accessory factor
VGVTESRIDWLVCPIGMPQIRGKEPAVIAAGIAAQLLIARERTPAPLVSPATQPA